MHNRLQKPIFLLACLVRAYHGRRLRTSGTGYTQSQKQVLDQDAKSKLFAQFLLGQDQQSAFRPCTLAAGPHLVASAPSRVAPNIRPVRPVMAAPDTLLNTPQATFRQMAQKGKEDSERSAVETLISSMMGGFQVGVAGLLCLTVCGNVPGMQMGFVKFMFGALFPACLMLVLNTGTQLFTAASMSAAYFEKKVGKRAVVKNWLLVYVGNIIGCASFAWIAAFTGLLGGGTATMAAGLGVAKTSGGSFGQMLVKGMMCNYLVTMAVFLGMQARDMMGRYIGIFLPVSTFLACGFEHSVANMFLLSSAMLAGAPITLKAVFVKNLIPVTIGNAMAAIFLVSAYFSYMFGAMGGIRYRGA